MIDKDILADFQAEAKGLLTELNEVVESLEEESEEFPTALLEQFAQRIDRIMGAAQTLNQLDPNHQGLLRIGAIAQLCKRLGYKAAEYKTKPLIPLFAAFWADTLEVVEELIDAVEDEAKSKAVSQAFSSVVQNRLTWLSEKVQQHAPQAATAAGGGKLADQMEIDKLLASMGK